MVQDGARWCIISASLITADGAYHCPVAIFNPLFDPTNPGASVAGTAAGWAGMPHNVTFKLELENYTNEHLKVFAIFSLGV